MTPSERRIAHMRRCRAQGLCTQCGLDCAGEHWRCDLCRAKAREMARAKYASTERGARPGAVEPTRLHERWYRDTQKAIRFARKMAETRKPVADLRYIAHVRPTGSYVAELFGHRVIR